jgi:glycosyltransferase involved in cell wall biosynthesis
MKEISIIIPTYKRVNLLDKILIKLTYEDICEIIVVDSDSNDGTQELIDGYRKKLTAKIKYYNVENNVSLKRNTGIRESSSKYLIFLDDDCIPTKGFIEHHYNSLVANHSTVNCGDIYFPNELVNKSNYIRYKESRHLKYRYSVDKNIFLDYRSIVTMNMSIRKSDIIKYNLFFDESFIGYGMEDNEYGCRIINSSMCIKSCQAAIIHMENNDSFIFCRKIYHTARDGVNRLKTINHNAAMNLNYSFFFELEYKHKNRFTKLSLILFSYLFNVKIAKYTLFFINYFDEYKIMYFPWIYKYVFACYYRLGVKGRKSAYKSVSEVSSKWY